MAAFVCITHPIHSPRGAPTDGAGYPQATRATLASWRMDICPRSDQLTSVIRGFGVRASAVHPVEVRTLTRPEGMLTAEWEGILAAGDRALFAYRVRTERERQREEQRDFVEGSGISQQTLSEWERGVRVHITTEMLHLASHLTGLHVAFLLERPSSAHTAEGRVFWTAVEAELAARRTGATRPTVPEIVARAAARGRS